MLIDNDRPRIIKNLLDVCDLTRLFLDIEKDTPVPPDLEIYVDHLLPLDHTISIVADYPNLFIPLMTGISEIISERQQIDHLETPARSIPSGNPNGLGKGLYRLVTKEWMAPYHLHTHLHAAMHDTQESSPLRQEFLFQARQSVYNDFHDSIVRNLKPSNLMVSFTNYIRILATELYRIEYSLLQRLTQDQMDTATIAWNEFELSGNEQPWLPTKNLLLNGSRFAKYAITEALNNVDRYQITDESAWQITKNMFGLDKKGSIVNPRPTSTSPSNFEFEGRKNYLTTHPTYKPKPISGMAHSIRRHHPLQNIPQWRDAHGLFPQTVEETTYGTGGNHSYGPLTAPPLPIPAPLIPVKNKLNRAEQLLRFQKDLGYSSSRG
jgi:hypothetical protein